MKLRITLAFLLALQIAAAPATHPSDPAASILAQAQAAAREGKHSQAIEEYRQVLALSPNDAAAHAGLGGSLLAVGDLDRAQSHIRRALELAPKDPSYHMLLGRLQIAQNQLDDAESAYSQAAKLSPKTAGAIWSDFASVLASKNDEHLATRIQQALERAVDADPPSPDALFTLGQIYVKAGRQEGKPYLQHFIQIQESLPKEQQNSRRIRLAKQMIRALDILKSTQDQ